MGDLDHFQECLNSRTKKQEETNHEDGTMDVMEQQPHGEMLHDILIVSS